MQTKSHLPVMEMASNAKPRYFPTPLSRTIPVPLDMSMAPIWLRQRHPFISPPSSFSRLQSPESRVQTPDSRLQTPDSRLHMPDPQRWV